MRYPLHHGGKPEYLIIKRVQDGNNNMACAAAASEPPDARIGSEFHSTCAAISVSMIFNLRMGELSL